MFSNIPDCPVLQNRLNLFHSPSSNYIVFKKLSFLLIIFLSINGCQKDEAGNLYLKENRVGVFNSNSLIVSGRTVSENMVPFNNPKKVPLGNLEDPVYGKTIAGFYVNFSMQGTGPDLGTGAILDSVVFSISKSGTFGSPGKQKINIYELKEKIPTTSLTSNAKLLLETKNLGGSEIDLSASIPRIRLDPEFSAEKFLDNSNFSSNEIFQEKFKGFLITGDSLGSGAGFSFFDLKNTGTRLTMYYSNSAGNGLTYDFFLDTNTTSSTYIYQKNKNSEFESLLNSESVNPANLYINGFGSSRLEMNLPLVINNRAGIHKAELILNIASEKISSVYYPPLLHIYYLNSSNQYIQIKDLLNNTGYFGGTFKADSMQYRFNITNHFQDIIAGKQDSLKIMITIPDPVVDPSRVVFIGPGNDKKKPVLNLIYNKI